MTTFSEKPTCLAGILLCALVLGCEPPPIESRDRHVSPHDRPPMDLAIELRQANYGGGSCMHAALISVLRWQVRMRVADWWRTTYRGAEDVPGLASRAHRLGMDYAYTTNGDLKFLEWASRTRRGAAIHFFSGHAVTFCGYENGQAVLLDNNNTDRLIRIDKDEFLRRWRAYGGYALTPVYSPAPPLPWL